MPPRIPGRAVVAGLETAVTTPCCCYEKQGSQWTKRAFSSTSYRQGLTRPRLQMRQWMQDKGEKLREHQSEGPLYVTGSQYKPFPSNPLYISEPVLSEDSREEIWRKVVQQGEAIKSVSANFGVDMRRVAAVVRLKEVEKAWERDVSFNNIFFYPFTSKPASSDDTTKHSISLEDIPRGYKILACEPL